MDKSIIFWATITIFVVGAFFLGALSPMYDHSGMEMTEDMSENRAAFVDYKKEMVSNLIAEGKYSCCLKIPCSYCIEKTPGHGEGESCFCLEDIVNGRHPCGECMGEILEGKGNPFLAEYFATAIAEEVGVKHLGTLKQIIFEKYGTAIESQS